MPGHGASTDWQQWHTEYDDPSSRLSRRLAVVKRYLRDAIDERPGPLRIISMCAGQGRDVIETLAGHPRRDEISARLVELDEQNATFARTSAAAEGLDRVEVVQADAALTDNYRDAVPAEIILTCGVFGNITGQDVRRIIEYLPSLAAPNATVLWTRGGEPDRDPAQHVREWFAEAGFEEVAFTADQTGFRVGAHRLVAEPKPFAPNVRLFDFIR